MPKCYFCKKEFEEWELEDREIFARYQVHAFKIVDNVEMHEECRENWEKDLVSWDKLK